MAQKILNYEMITIKSKLNGFTRTVAENEFNGMIDKADHEIVEVYKSKDVATFEVTILDNKKKYYKFKWQVEKYNIEGTLKDCWLTTAVSQPMPLGSSI